MTDIPDKKMAEVIQKLQAKTRQDIYTLMHPKQQAERKGCFATHVGKYTDPLVPWDIAWCASDAEKNIDSPYVSCSSISTSLLDGIANSASSLPPIRLLCSTPRQLWGINDDDQMYQHLVKDDEIAKEIFQNVPDFSYEDIRNYLLHFEKCPPPRQTSVRMRQIFFPVANPEDEKVEHVLTVLPSSVVMSEINHRCRAMLDERWSMEKKCEPYVHLPSKRVTVEYGGSKAQNLGALASAEHGIFYTFPSIAPSVPSDGMSYPHGDFFFHCFYFKRLRKSIIDFFQASQERAKNIHTKNYFETVRDTIFNAFIEEAFRLRSLDGGWSRNEELHLPASQVHFLDATFLDAFSSGDFDELCDAATIFLNWCIQRLITKDTPTLSFEGSIQADFVTPLRKEFSLLFPRKGD